LIGIYITLIQYRSYGYVLIISGTNGHQKRTTNVPYLASWIASSYERIQNPCKDSNPEWLGASGLKKIKCNSK
jgi:hypothetical protein